MKTLFIILAIVAGIILLTVIMSLLIANVLFKKVIPRQDGVKVNMDEMADADKWQEYMKVIHPNKDFMLSLPCEHVTVKSNDGLTLHGDYYPAEKPSDNLVICFHGYTSARMSSCSFAAYMHKLGFDCLLVDNRAHGDSEGEYIGFPHHHDGDAHTPPSPSEPQLQNLPSFQSQPESARRSADPREW